MSVFGRLLKEVVGMHDDVLVKRRRGSDDEDGADALPSPRPSRLLPGRSDGAGIAVDDAGLKRADVDAKLQRVSRDDRCTLPLRRPRSISRRRLGRYPPR